MNEMVETVAEALWVGMFGPGHGPFQEKATEDGKAYYRQWARKVIAAMREPTDAMIKAGAEGWEADSRYEFADTGIWQRMIDAAIAK